MVGRCCENIPSGPIKNIQSSTIRKNTLSSPSIPINLAFSNSPNENISFILLFREFSGEYFPDALFRYLTSFNTSAVKWIISAKRSLPQYTSLLRTNHLPGNPCNVHQMDWEEESLFNWSKSSFGIWWKNLFLDGKRWEGLPFLYIFSSVFE